MEKGDEWTDGERAGVMSGYRLLLGLNQIINITSRHGPAGLTGVGGVGGPADGFEVLVLVLANTAWVMEIEYSDIIQHIWDNEDTLKMLLFSEARARDRGIFSQCVTFTRHHDCWPQR